MKEPNRLLETQLYQPIHEYFEKLGYEVHGEVQNCDIIAVKDDELIIIELKRSLSLDLLIQAVKRQRLSEYVYITIPKPKHNIFSKKWKDLCLLVRRLELGLITVSFQEETPKVEIIFGPTPFNRQKSMQVAKRKTRNLKTEIAGRHGNYNIGGSTGTKLMTSYKENSIQIACYLSKFGQLSPKELKKLGAGKKTQSILRNNFYGWFERVDKGIYRISDKGTEEIKVFPELVAYYEGLIGENENASM